MVEKVRFGLITLLIWLMPGLTFISCAGDPGPVIPDRWQGIYRSDGYFVSLSADGTLSWSGFLGTPDGSLSGATIVNGGSFSGAYIRGDWVYIAFHGVNMGVIANHTRDAEGRQWILAMGSLGVTHLVSIVSNMGANIFPVPSVTEGFPSGYPGFLIRRR